MKIAVAMLQQWHRENPARLLQAALLQAERLAQMAPELEALHQQLEVKAKRIAQLEAALEEAQRAAHRQAAPFRGDPQKRAVAPKRPGRKRGHPGACRPEPEQIDESLEVQLCSCPKCGGTQFKDQNTIEQLIEDIPPVRPHVTRLTTYHATCAGCGQSVRSQHPLQMSLAIGAAGVHLGPRALAMAADLNKAKGLSMRKTCAVLRDCFGLQLSPGGLSQAMDRLAAKVKPQYDALATELRQAPALHSDETSWWVAGPGWWLWVFTTQLLTFYVVAQSRGRDLLSDILGKDFGHWGAGTTSSSDGQYFHVGGRGEHAGQVNARYGSGPGVTFYTHISDRYAPFHTKVINATVRDATHVLDGLLYHESDLRIEEHYTDTAGFTDHVFGLCHLLGFRFAPRIRDLADRRLYTAEKAKRYPTLQPFIGGTINLKQLLAQWSEILRLGCSIRLGTVTSSLILRKLASYPRQNALALALREFGRIERTLFTLDWLLDKNLRQRVTAGLNKGELKNSLAKAVCFNRLGELRDRSFEAQRHRASGLNLVVGAIILWNTVYLERAIGALRQQGRQIDEGLLKHVAPVHWNHINLTVDYSWRQNKRVEKGGFRPLRISPEP